MSYLGPRAKSLREFPRQPLMLGLIFSCYFHILFTPRTLLNSHVEALCLWKDLCSWKNQRRKKVLGKKREKKRPKDERKSTILSRKEKKNPFVKATSTGGATLWRPDFEHKGRRQTKICHT